MILRQEAPYPETLRDLVIRSSYKKDEGWQTWLADIERDPGCSGLTLVIQRHGPDSYHPERVITVNHYFPVPPATYDERSWTWWLFERYGDVELHERMENFKVDGKPVYPPAHGPGNNPYLVLQYGTDLDRRTKYTGEVNPG